MYLVEKSINKLYNTGHTFFLNPKELNEVTSHLKKNTFRIYKPYKFSEKAIIYTEEFPKVILYEINTSAPIRHQDILGSLFGLKIDDDLFGDIIISNKHYYFYTFEKMKPFFEMEFTKIGKSNIELVERDIDLLNEYEPNFERIKIITPSLRADAIIAKVIHTNRNEIKKMISDKIITYNYDLLKDGSKLLKIGDTFSVRKYGKFKFDSIISNTKKDNIIIQILKYIDKNT